MLFDPPPELAPEGIVVPELEASCRFCGSKGLARRARVDLLLVCHRTIPRLRLGALVAEVSTVETPQGSCPTPDAVPVTRSPPSLAQSGRSGGVRRGDRARRTESQTCWRRTRRESSLRLSRPIGSPHLIHLSTATHIMKNSRSEAVLQARNEKMTLRPSAASIGSKTLRLTQVPRASHAKSRIWRGETTPWHAMRASLRWSPPRQFQCENGTWTRCWGGRWVWRPAGNRWRRSKAGSGCVSAGWPWRGGGRQASMIGSPISSLARNRRSSSWPLTPRSGRSRASWRASRACPRGKWRS